MQLASWQLRSNSPKTSVCPSVHWDNSKDGQTFSKEQIFLLIDLVIDNSFFRFGNKVFRQKIGIPMGVDPAPQMANLYLYYYEAAFMEKLTKQDYSKAKKFNNTSRFIDDLGTLNNDGILVTQKAKIYLVELMLNVENQDDNHATFLDIEVNVEGDQFKIKTYDKRENYKFEIVNYPDLSGNIPHGAAYGVYTSQVIRYARVCNEADDFKERVKLLTNKLIKKGFTINCLKNTMKKCLGKHSWIAKKYKRTDDAKSLLMQEVPIEYIIDIGLQHIPSTRWQKLLGSAALNNSY